MRVVVAGGSGFVGRHVVRRLIGRGHEAFSVSAHAPALPEPGERVVLCDLADQDLVERAAEACSPADAIVWLAASIRKRTSIDQTATEDLRVMVEAPLRFLGKQGVPPVSFVFASSIQAYGAPRRLPVDEDHPADPFILYGAAKLCAESYLRIACEARGTPLAALRISFIYGPGQHRGNVIPSFLAAVRSGKPPILHGDGSGVRDDVYVGDVARAIEMAIDRRASGTFNIATARPHTTRDLAEIACRIAGGGLRPESRPVESGWIDRWFTADRAREAFGFEAETPIEEGMRAMWEEEAA